MSFVICVCLGFSHLFQVHLVLDLVLEELLLLLAELMLLLEVLVLWWLYRCRWSWSRRRRRLLRGLLDGHQLRVVTIDA